MNITTLNDYNKYLLACPQVIPDTNGRYIVDTDGNVTDLETFTKLDIIYQDGNPVVYLPNYGKVSTLNLISTLFRGYKLSLEELRNVEIVIANGNWDDHNISNLIPMLSKCGAVMAKGSCRGKKLYPIPNYTRYYISENEDLIWDKYTDEIIRPTNGAVVLLCDVTGLETSCVFNTLRMLATKYIPRDVQKCKLQNFDGKYQWVVRPEDSHHRVAVIGYNFITKEEITFRTIADAAKYANLYAGTIHRAINSSKMLVYTGGWMFKRASSSRAFTAIDVNNESAVRYGTVEILTIKDDEVVVTLDNLAQVSDRYDLSRGSLYRARQYHKPKGYFIKDHYIRFKLADFYVVIG